MTILRSQNRPVVIHFEVFAIVINVRYTREPLGYVLSEDQERIAEITDQSLQNQRLSQ